MPQSPISQLLPHILKSPGEKLSGGLRLSKQCVKEASAVYFTLSLLAAPASLRERSLSSAISSMVFSLMRTAPVKPS